MPTSSGERVYRWRGFGGRSLEVLWLVGRVDGFDVRSGVIDAGSAPFVVSYDWQLDPSWRTRSLRLRLRTAHESELAIERTGDASWQVDGRDRADLAGCEEIDLSITPFCNALALRRFGPPPGDTGELTVLYVELPALALSRSRQRYERLGPDRFRYIDLGRFSGFSAELSVDADGMIRSYEGLFERIEAE
jgi:uncharacterized protein